MEHLSNIARTSTGFRAWLANAMVREEVTMTDLGRYLGHGNDRHRTSRYKRVSRWLNGTHIPSRPEVEAIAKRFNTTVAATDWNGDLFMEDLFRPTTATTTPSPNAGRKKSDRLQDPGFFGENLRDLLEKNGKTQTWLAARVGDGCYQTQISQYVLGKDVPTPERAERIAAALNTTVLAMRTIPPGAKHKALSDEERLRQMLPDIAPMNRGPNNTLIPSDAKPVFDPGTSQVTTESSEELTIRIRFSDLPEVVKALKAAGISVTI